MKYIVWDLISPYDGYWQTHCNSIAEVQAALRKSSNLTKEECEGLCNGHSDRVQVIEGHEIQKDVFVTSGPMKIVRTYHD